MANNKQQPDNGSDFMAMVAVISLLLAGVWFSRDKIWDWLVKQLDPYMEIFFTVGITLLLVAVIWFVLPWILKLVFYFKRLGQMKTREIVLSRDDTTEPYEITRYLDSCAGMLKTKFPFYGHFIGFDHLVWHPKRIDGQNLIEISAPEPILSEIEGALQAVYQNVVFRDAQNTTPENLPEEYLQMRLSRNHFYGLQTLRDYQKVFTESFFASLENCEGNAGMQVVMVPVSNRKQKKLNKRAEKFEKKYTARSAADPEDPGLGKTKQKELQGSFENRGRAHYRVEIRIWADSREARRAIVGSLGETSSENELVPELLLNHWIRRVFKKLWWFWVQRNMPAIGLGPRVSLSSFQMATFIQLPTMRIRSSGFERNPIRRMPVPRGIPNDLDRGFVLDMQGNLAGIEDEMREKNLLILGMAGGGKTTAMKQYMARPLMDPEKAGLICTPALEDAQDYLQYIPPDKPTYIIDAYRPGKWGLNILDDQEDASTVAGDILTAFRQAFGKEAVMEQSAEMLQQPIYLLFKARQVNEEWRKAIPRVDLRHIERVWVDDDFRDALVQSLPEDCREAIFWRHRLPGLMKSSRDFENMKKPILNKLNQLLSNQYAEALLCHPNPISLYDVIRNKGVVVIYTAKQLIGTETAALITNIVTVVARQAVERQARLPKEERIEFHQAYDEFHLCANEAIEGMMLEARKYKSRLVAATPSYSTLNQQQRETFTNLFIHKLIFRSENINEMELWAKTFALRFSNFISNDDATQDRVWVGPEDFNSLPDYHAIARFTVGGKPLPAFLVQTRPADPRGNPEWVNQHPWPQEGNFPELDPIRLPKIQVPSAKEQQVKSQSKPVKPIEVYPSVGSLSSGKVRQIVERAGIPYEEAKPLLEEILPELTPEQKGGYQLEVILREELEKRWQQSSQEESDSKEGWPEVGGLDPEQVEAICTEMGVSLETARPLLEEIDREIREKRKKSGRAPNRPQMIRKKLKQLQAV